MTHPDFRAELQALMDAAESFADPAIGHGIPWKTAMDRARAALAAPQQGAPTMPASVESLPEQQRRWYTLGWSAALSFTRYGGQAVPMEPPP